MSRKPKPADYRCTIKVQRPIAPPPEQGGEALIYDRHRRLLLTVAWTVVTSIMGDDPKRYFRATHARNGELHIGERVPDEDW